MSRTSPILRIILLVSAAHALVHLLEQSIASVELVIADDFGLSRRESGLLGSALRLPYGIGAFFAGLLADRFGEKRILVLYLLGAAVVAISFLPAGSASLVYAQLFSLGCFASMYHPAGLALLANQTTPQERSRALGVHGIFGSLGIASAPFLAGLMLSVREGDWRGYYLLLGLLSAALGMAVWWWLSPIRTETAHAAVPEKIGTDPGNANAASALPASTANEDSGRFQLFPFTVLVIGTALGGTVYSGVLHFLPRNLKETGAMDVVERLTGSPLDKAALGNYAAALALVCGAFGQWTAGRMARPKLLPVMLAAAYAANIPFLIWMAYSSGSSRLAAACLWAFVHFMNQPLYNSLLPEYLPRHRRSLGYGFSNMMGFGVGALGPPLVGAIDESFGGYTISFLTLSGLALIAAFLPLLLLIPRKTGLPQ
ncbi:MAG: MFS transporter [Planctomycetaceae bacterium]|nr:MFS transporter [Planctomycetaceae bacterium]